MSNRPFTTRRGARDDGRGTKKDAQRELNRILHEIDEGAFVDATRETVGDYLDRWLHNYAKTNVAGKTYERYSEIVTGHLKPALGKIILKDLKPLHLQGYYSDALESGRLDGTGGLAPRTVHHHPTILSEALRQAVRWRMLAGGGRYRSQAGRRRDRDTGHC